jgi:Leucine-rich repeat (LRR) protein
VPPPVWSTIYYCKRLLVPVLPCQVGLKGLYLASNEALAALPQGLCSLAGLEELDLFGCNLTALPEGIGGLTWLKELKLCYNEGLSAVPEGLCGLVELEVLQLERCGLTALPEGTGRLAGLKTLNLYSNMQGF